MSSVCNIIPEQNKSVLGKKQLAIHSEDRDKRKWPHASNFSITLPEKLEQIKSLSVKNIAIPTTLYNFSEKNMNTKFYLSLDSKSSKEYLITLPDGQYCAKELAKCLEKNINEEIGSNIFKVTYNNITQKICFHCNENFSLIFNKTIHYNCISNDKFKGIEWYLGFEKKIYKSKLGLNKKHLINKLPNQRLICLEMNFPYYLIDDVTREEICKFLKNNLKEVKKSWITQGNCSVIFNENNGINNTSIVTILYQTNNISRPRFEKTICECFKNKFDFFTRDGENIDIKLIFDYESGNINIPLEYQNIIVFNNQRPYFSEKSIISPQTINVVGDSVIYLEIDKYNSIDELVPYPQATSSSINSFNTYGGKVNSALSSIPLVRNKDDCGYPGSYEYVDSNGFLSNKKEFFYNSVESVKTLNFKFRYHDGRPVDFSDYDIFFTLELEYLMPDAINQFNSHKIRNNYT